MTVHGGRSSRSATGLLARTAGRLASLRPRRRRGRGRGKRPIPARGASERRIRATSQRARERLRRSIDSWAERTSARAGGGPGIGLIGLDVSRPPQRLRTSSWAPVVAVAVLGALFLTVLRMDVIRMRFALARKFEAQIELEEQKRVLTVEMRQLRDPAEIAQRAQELGFRRAERLIDLEPPAEAPGGTDPAGGAREGLRRVALATADDHRAGTRP